MPTETASARSRYEVLAAARQDHLERARNCSKLTIPTLIPEEGQSKGSRFYQPYQSLGGRAVNNLSSKLLLALMPPSQPFFKLSVDPFVISEMKEAGGDEMVRESVRALSMIERAFLHRMEMVTDRVAVSEALKHLLVAGNVLLQDTEEAGLKVFKLDEFVVKRDREGNPVEILIKEELHWETLPASIQELLGARNSKRGDEKAELFTWIELRDGRFYIRQEVEETLVPESQGEYLADQLPFFALRMVPVDGEDYGRSFVDEYYGDLKSLEGLYKALVMASAAAAKILFLINPNGTTQIDAVSKAQSCDIIAGNADDVSILQVEKFNDFRVTLETAQRIEQRLAQAFLMTSSLQRDAERVTAEEVRLMAQELEEGLGGVYSTLSMEFQLRYVKVRLKKLEKTVRNWPKVDDQVVQPMVTTGLNALGRGYERDRLLQYISALTQTIGPEATLELVDGREVADRLAISIGIDTDGLIRTPEQIAEAAQARQDQALQSQVIDKLGPEAMKMAGAQAPQEG